jgi:hypothetical protein
MKIHEIHLFVLLNAGSRSAGNAAAIYGITVYEGMTCGQKTEARANPSASNITPSVATSAYVAAMPSNAENADLSMIPRNIWVSPPIRTQRRVTATIAGNSEDRCDEDHNADDLGRLSIELIHPLLPARKRRGRSLIASLVLPPF